ncbi:MAG: hypothetical protein WEF86_17115 [Gemmatimonadota bacterium]
MSRPMVRAAMVALTLISSAGAAQAQTQYQQAISANPFGLLLEFFNGEYERVVTESSTAGFGGSFYSPDEEEYLNADLFFRYYPQGRPLDGWAFGAKAGVTKVEDYGTYFGFGFDVNHSWLLGSNENFYVGIGLGLKRLVGVDEGDDLIDYVPTIRLVNVGFAF